MLPSEVLCLKISPPTKEASGCCAQCNGTGPPDQIQLIHGERYMKTMVTQHTAFANSCMGGKRLTGFVGV